MELYPELDGHLLAKAARQLCSYWGAMCSELLLLFFSILMVGVSGWLLGQTQVCVMMILEYPSNGHWAMN